jgi:hypothetical protein
MAVNKSRKSKRNIKKVANKKTTDESEIKLRGGQIPMIYMSYEQYEAFRKAFGVK